MYNNSSVINERSIHKSIIKILNTSAPIAIPNSSPKSEYSLNKNFFDPTKSSPPNEFMLKLYMRDQMYNNNILSHKNDAKREIQ